MICFSQVRRADDYAVPDGHHVNVSSHFHPTFSADVRLYRHDSLPIYASADSIRFLYMNHYELARFGYYAYFCRVKRAVRQKVQDCC